MGAEVGENILNVTYLTNIPSLLAHFLEGVFAKQKDHILAQDDELLQEESSCRECLDDR